ncbi:glycosyltransferase family 2 protein [Paenibacillus rhizovicinus]|uniref:Glycosyltransferase family 2 protein n=1 Tax=Paenibacillus rhizovicinus TaxID=2704463 RepID=A0A6C0P4I8_9BACL|nr:glycosyltransferase family 2 protein [Paenibacillus rhizovicinus]QHW33409.1 glycosyltransferase family 2 protein [Paenibacillus rhizovicinus]
MKKQTRSRRRRQVPLRSRRRHNRHGRPKKSGNTYTVGLAAGYQEGVRAGTESFGTYFDGTSIIIPSFNQRDYLQKCIESIHDHTPSPYEIIVVDNASTDGSAEYLQSVGGVVRYRVLDRNRGFAGATNVGLMMAKGNKLLLLNNDTIVTPHWLDNLLACLNSDPNIGMVGPVTNYISGDQRIEVPYTEENGILPFARRFNASDPAKWQRTDRLTGFCLLFRRELWEQTGYLDEGFEIGNFEDDDFNIRVRLQGYALIIARDTFIHHFGSVSMKALGSKFHEVNDRNEHVYMDKWGNPHDLIHAVRNSGAGRPPQGESSFFPQGVVVRGVTETRYWIEGGMRRPIVGEAVVPVVRLSQIDVRRWPAGEPVSAAEVEASWYDQPQIWEADGVMYMAENGLRRRVPSAKAAEAWSLSLRQAALSPEQLGQLGEGLPVIAPVRVAEHL